MTRRLKRIGPLKFGLVAGVVQELVSLIFIPFFLISFVIAAATPHSNSQEMPVLGMGLAVIMCVVMPFFYAAFGFLFGALAALIYNLVARWTGGIEFEVE